MKKPLLFLLLAPPISVVVGALLGVVIGCVHAFLSERQLERNGL